MHGVDIKTYEKVLTNEQDELPLKQQIFHDFIPWKNERLYLAKLGKLNVVIKMEELNRLKDEIFHEYRVGLIMNNLRNVIPSTVYTIGAFSGNPPTKYYPGDVHTPHSVKYIVVEHINGNVVDKKFPFEEHLRIWVQIACTLHLAYTSYGFVHYNLHRGNVVVQTLNTPKIVNYYGIIIQTDKIPVIIDYGRSFTYKTSGPRLKSQGVYPEARWQHDILYYLCSALRETYPKELNKLLKFYGLQYNPNIGMLDNLQQKQPHSIYVHPRNLLQWLSEEFNFQSIYISSLSIYRPKNIPISNPKIQPLKEVSMKKHKKFKTYISLHL